MHVRWVIGKSPSWTFLPMPEYIFTYICTRGSSWSRMWSVFLSMCLDVATRENSLSSPASSQPLTLMIRWFGPSAKPQHRADHHRKLRTRGISLQSRDSNIYFHFKRQSRIFDRNSMRKHNDEWISANITFNYIHCQSSRIFQLFINQELC